MRLQDHISQRFATLFAIRRKELARVRKHGSEDAIHGLRVASRRILETLRVFEGAIDAEAARPVRRSLKRWMRLSGSVRDLDIAIALAAQCHAPDAEGFRARWQRKRDRRWNEIAPRLAGKSTVAELGDPAELVPDSAAPPQSVIWDYALSAAENASVALPLLLDRHVLHGNRIPAGEAGVATDDAVYHGFRLRTKRFRYTLESFEAFYPPAFAATLAQLKNFQQILGSLHDCEVAAELARSTQQPPREASAPSAELPPAGLSAFLSERAARLRQEWHQAWDTFAAPESQRVLRELLREQAAAPRPQPARKKAKAISSEPAPQRNRKAS